MSIYKRNGMYYVDITTPSGKRIRRSTETENRKKALEYHDKIKAELWDIAKLKKKPERLFEELIILFLNDSEGQKRLDAKQSQAKFWINIFHGRYVSSITGEEIFNNLPNIHLIHKTPLSNATRNRYRASILRAFSLGYKLGWVDKIPYIPRMKEPKIRVRWITREQAEILINNLSLLWMKKVCYFALLTGARMSEILSLRWDNINIHQKMAIVTNDNAKSGIARSLPLNKQALDLILSLDKNSNYIFTRETNKRIFDIDRRDFKKALFLSNIENFNFHDLRHTWASWHVQSGTPLFTLKELGGWETLEMVKKYAHLNSDHLSKFANNVTLTTQNLF